MTLNQPSDRQTTARHPGEPWRSLGAELVYTQDLDHICQDFHWQKAQNRGIQTHHLPRRSLQSIFPQSHWHSYTERVKRVLARQIPERCRYSLCLQGRCFGFELTIVPIPQEQGNTEQLLVMGYELPPQEILTDCSLSLPCQNDPYQKLLIQISRRIRSTLDLVTIWQQTVESLGEAFQASRCLLISHSPSPLALKVEAEYRQPQELRSLLGQQFTLEQSPELRATLQEKRLLEFIFPEENEWQCQSALFTLTSHQNQVNGLICLQQCDRPRLWNQGEKELLEELGEQVGTAIAQATLYQELEQATEAAKEASRIKSDFLASTTHELRTPLNGIIGFLQLILDGMADDPEEQQEFIEEAHKSALHLLNLINDILDIAKIEAGKMELLLEAVELKKLLANVESFAAPQARQKQLEFAISLPRTYDEIVVYGNYQRLLQVLLNLVGNALKFTDTGSITVTAEVIQKKIHRHDLDFSGLVKISVEDTGIGVPLDKQNKLFQNFVQVRGGHTRKYGGTGLGLAISKKLVEAMGGKISFYSMGEGLGSRVSFSVPLEHLPLLNTSDSPPKNESLLP